MRFPAEICGFLCRNLRVPVRLCISQIETLQKSARKSALMGTKIQKKKKTLGKMQGAPARGGVPTCGISTLLYPFNGIQEGFSVEPARMIWGRICSEMIRVSAQKSELQAKSRSCRPKVRITAGRPESPNKGTRTGFRCCYRERALKPS